MAITVVVLYCLSISSGRLKNGAEASVDVSTSLQGHFHTHCLTFLFATTYGYISEATDWTEDLATPYSLHSSRLDMGR